MAQREDRPQRAPGAPGGSSGRGKGGGQEDHQEQGKGQEAGQPSAEAAATGWMLQVGRVPGSAKREGAESSQAPELLLLHSHIGRGETPQSAKT